jgi:hypothetical protein
MLFNGTYRVMTHLEGFNVVAMYEDPQFAEVQDRLFVNEEKPS